MTSGAGRDSVQGSHDGRDSTDGSAVRHSPAEAERRHHRPNTAPAYYLGHPAALWITITRPRRRPTGARYPIETTASGDNPTRDSRILQHS